MAKNKSGLFGKVSIAVLTGVVVIMAGVFLYLRFGPLPVAVADLPFPFEKKVVKIALRARINRQMKEAPFGVSESVLEAGARIYRDHDCSVCHGVPGRESDYSKHMYPPPPQLWKKHGPHGAVGVSDDEPGFSHWIVSNGIRLSAMPSYANSLSDTEIWQVSLLLKNADKPLPPTVEQILKEPMR